MCDNLFIVRSNNKNYNHSLYCGLCNYDHIYYRNYVRNYKAVVITIKVTVITIMVL